MNDQFATDTLGDTPDYKRIRWVGGGRIQVTHRYNDGYVKFRGGVEVSLPVYNLQNVGSSALTVMALADDPNPNNPPGTMIILKDVTLIPRERLGVFAPPPGTQHLVIIHADGYTSNAVLECDDIPRV